MASGVSVGFLSSLHPAKEGPGCRVGPVRQDFGDESGPPLLCWGALVSGLVTEQGEGFLDRAFPLVNVA